MRAGSVLFGALTPEVEWPHCAGRGGGGWSGRAQRALLCAQLSVWAPASEGVGEREGEGWGPGGEEKEKGEGGGQGEAAEREGGGGGGRRGAGEGWGSLYVDDGWSDGYLRGAAGWRSASFKLRGGGLEIVIQSASHHVFPSAEPGQPDDPALWGRWEEEGGDGRASPPYSWRVLVHGVAPPTRVALSRRMSSSHSAGEAILLPFYPPAASERLRRADAKEGKHWEPVSLD
ncbi:MAG: hypothetical protein SGPRY_014189, partial [Prymnesium sp.]